jgi:hypothetical protein
LCRRISSGSSRAAREISTRRPRAKSDPWSSRRSAALGVWVMARDRTRGRSRRWSMGICGNRAKQIAHRHRLKESR